MWQWRGIPAFSLLLCDQSRLYNTTPVYGMVHYIAIPRFMDRNALLLCMLCILKHTYCGSAAALSYMNYWKVLLHCIFQLLAIYLGMYNRYMIANMLHAANLDLYENSSMIKVIIRYTVYTYTIIVLYMFI